MILLTSTAIEIDEELLNRCLVLTVDEGREQTRAIHRIQREAHTLEGLKARDERKRILEAHKSFQRQLRPLFVHNPYARELTFLDEKTRARRDHTKYLALIDAIALLHQLQRPILTISLPGETLEYVEATLDDIALANGIAAEILGRSLDELPPQTRRLLMLLDEMVTKACQREGVERSDYRFSRRDVRDATGWGDTQLKIHLSRLVELEYLLVHRGGRGQSFVFELVYGGEGKDGSRFVLGLIDTQKLGAAVIEPSADPAPLDGPDESGYDSERSGSLEDRSGPEAERSGPGRPSVGPWSGVGRGEETSLPSAPRAAPLDSRSEMPEKAQIPPSTKTPSYPPSGRSPKSSPVPLSSPVPSLDPSQTPPTHDQGSTSSRRSRSPRPARLSPRLNLLRFPPRHVAAAPGSGHAAHATSPLTARTS
jgi:hypothetical protein